jgi:UDP-N-acetylmuramate--alanine ligase
MQLFIPDDPRPIHFMGIGGAGMSALALIAKRRGIAVSGCDIIPDGAADLANSGIVVTEGHGADHISGVRALIYTSAVPNGHPELEAARAAGIPVVRRAEALGQIVNAGKTVAIAGTHGKTTTTAMTTVALNAAGMDPTGIAGGRVPEWEGNARIGERDLFVVEADEYDRSFLALEPSVAIINNVEADHLECYGTVGDLEAAFVEFANRAEQVFYGAEDRGAVRVARELDVAKSAVGTGLDVDLQISSVARDADGTSATIRMPDGLVVELRLPVPGLHNIRNAAMALGATYALGGDVKMAAQGLSEFSGVARRFEVLGSVSDVTVVDDYAHHPTEVAATLAAARQRFPGRRLVAVFQPHLYSRTEANSDAFGIVLAAADLVVVTPVYAAREEPIPGVTGEAVAIAAGNAGVTAEWISDLAALHPALTELVQAGDVVLTLGAGDITKVGPKLLSAMQGTAA